MALGESGDTQEPTSSWCCCHPKVSSARTTVGIELKSVSVRGLPCWLSGKEAA